MKNLSEDTIAALATPPGEGGVGVIRLSGAKALSIADSICQFKNKSVSTLTPRVVHYGLIKNISRVVDNVLVTVFKSPQSYTGEDVVEIAGHGSPYILKEILHLLEKNGARLARPGEFTERAFLNGKLDLAQAEAVADLISAGSNKMNEASTDQLRGVLSQRISEIKNPLISLLAHTEANLDFVEEDIPGLAQKELLAQLNTARFQMEALLDTSRQGKIFKEGLHIVLAGAPNAGKSSLFNALLLNERAIVSNIPGTTRDTLEEQMEWSGIRVVMTDTAGLRLAKNQIERAGAKRTETALKCADIILWIIDASKQFSKDDERAYKSIHKRPYILVLNKSDKNQKISKTALLEKYKPAALVETSAVKGHGLNKLKETVLTLTEKNISTNEGAPVITRMRHQAHLKKSLEHIKKAAAAASKGVSEEAITIDMRAAVEELGAITGENVSTQVLNSIFSQFCIGK